MYTRSFSSFFEGIHSFPSLVVLISLSTSYPSRSLRCIVCGSTFRTSIDREALAFLLILHHGFRTGYLDPPPASGPRHVPPTVDTAGLRSALDQDDFPAGVRPQDAPLDQPGAGWARARWTRDITAVVEQLDRGVVHTPAAATAGQQCVASAARALNSCFASIDQPRTRARQQRHTKRLAVDEDAVSTKVRQQPVSAERKRCGCGSERPPWSRAYRKAWHLHLIFVCH